MARRRAHTVRLAVVGRHREALRARPRTERDVRRTQSAEQRRGHRRGELRAALHRGSVPLRGQRSVALRLHRLRPLLDERDLDAELGKRHVHRLVPRKRIAVLRGRKRNEGLRRTRDRRLGKARRQRTLTGPGRIFGVGRNRSAIDVGRKHHPAVGGQATRTCALQRVRIPRKDPPAKGHTVPRVHPEPTRRVAFTQRPHVAIDPAVTPRANEMTVERVEGNIENRFQGGGPRTPTTFATRPRSGMPAAP